MLNIIVSLIPVMLFLTALIYIDSFKLVKSSIVLLCIASGIAAAAVAYFISLTVVHYSFNQQIYIRYAAPVIEEMLKSVLIIYLLLKHKIGFMVDAAIYGFAAGAGFALLENIYYLNSVDESNLLLWIVRGFGTAVMHGGTTALFSILSKNLADRKKKFNLSYFIPGFIVAVIIHSFFNHLLLSPVIITIVQIVLLPVIFIIVFQQSEKMLKEWMETGMDNDVKVLEQINQGRLSDTHIGEYLISLQTNFSDSVIGDMLCYIKIHMELAVKAKGVLLLKEAGLPVTIDSDTKEKFNEIKYLEKSIGPTGRLAISPVLHNTTHDLWQIYMLEKS